MSSFKLIKNKQFLSKPQTFSIHNINDKPLYEDLYEKKTNVKGIWDFCTPDSREKYKKLLDCKPENWYYRHNEVKYTLNSEGYRTKEFNEIDWKSSIVMFGCSHVFGTGNDDNFTIPILLENKIKIPVINMGINAASIKSIAHNSLSLHDSYEIPKMIIFGWTSLSRKSEYGQCDLDGDHTYKRLENVTDCVLTNMLLINMIKAIWKDKCPIYEFSFFRSTAKVIGCDYYKNIDYARDDIHYGIKSHHSISEKIYNKIKNNLK